MQYSMTASKIRAICVYIMLHEKNILAQTRQFISELKTWNVSIKFNYKQ